MTLPQPACDTHVHFYDASYPVAPTTVLRPPDAGVDRYSAVQHRLGLQRVVVVQPTTYGFDNSCQIAAAAQFGDDARLVVVVDGETPRDELQRLHGLGARGARFHMLPGGVVSWDALAPTAERIADLGWHIQLQLDGNQLGNHLDRLVHLPTTLVIDHVGRFMPPPSPSSSAFGALVELMEGGNTWVKLSAPYESTHDGAPTYPTVTALVDQLVARWPHRLLWASNWPHPGQTDPIGTDDLAALTLRWLPTAELRRQVLVDNPSILYDFTTSGAPR